MDLQAWLAREPCEADGLKTCGRCKPRDLPSSVWISAGGQAFHRTRRCDALTGGQAAVARRGGEPTNVEPILLNVALGDDRTPCLVCFPEAAGKA